MIYYIYKDNKVYGSTNRKELIADIALVKRLEEYQVGQTEIEDYEPNNNKYLLQDGEIVLNPNYEVEPAKKEQQRIQELSMTKSDFFDGTIRAFGLDQDDLQPAIEAILTQLSISDIDKKVAMNNYKNAKDFYRKHTLFSLLSDREIPISETQSINVTSSQWDRFFDETDKRNPEAYKYLIS